MSREKQNGGDGYPLYLKSYIYLLLGRLSRYYVKKRITVDTDDKDFFEMLQYIEENFDSDITVRSLSDRFGYNEAYFCRKFKKTTGLPPRKIYHDLKARKGGKTAFVDRVHLRRNCGALRVPRPKLFFTLFFGCVRYDAHRPTKLKQKIDILTKNGLHYSAVRFLLRIQF